MLIAFPAVAVSEVYLITDNSAGVIAVNGRMRCFDTGIIYKIKVIAIKCVRTHLCYMDSMCCAMFC